VADGSSGAVRDFVPKHFFWVNMRAGADGSADDGRVARTCDDVFIVVVIVVVVVQLTL